MDETFFTLGAWRVKPGQEAAFAAAWKELGVVFLRLPNPPPAGSARLIQSLTDPTLFYSFGPWPRLEDIQAMRQDPAAQAGIARLRDLCIEAAPGSFKVIATA